MPQQQELFNIVLGVAAFFGGWWMKTLWASMKELQLRQNQFVDRMSQTEVAVARLCAAREESQRNFEALFRKLDRIEDRITEKFDERKSNHD